MPKKIVIPNSLELIDKIIDKVDGFIIGLNELSINLPFYLDEKEMFILIDKLNQNNKEIFISLNKNMHNSDLSKLKDVMTKLDSVKITGVIYYDASVVNIYRELGLKFDLVWGQEHMTTNYFTINYWHSLGINYTLLSSDITLDEIIDINKNTSSKLMIQLFGYLPMFTSYRHLINNYLKTFNIDDNSGKYFIEKEDKSYSIVDESNGTTVYSNNILNGLGEVLVLKDIDYIVLNSYNIESDKFIKVIEIFNEVNDKNYDELNKEINNMFNNIDKGFLYKETVYKVKNHE